MTKHFLLTVSLSAAFAVLIASGCGPVTGGCQKNGTCDTGTGGGGGTGGTGGIGGNGDGGHGGTGGTGGTAGAGGGGSTVACNSTTCSGCCNGNTCVPLNQTTDIYCGINGAACVGCQGQDHCQTGACTGGTGGGSGGSGGAGGGGGTYAFDAGTFPTCVPRDAGTTACTTECPRGFRCLGGQCILNGGNGPLQVTLRWNTQEDLDLHLDEPLPDGGSCEIYYSDPNDVDGGNPSTCGAVGSLDLDSEAACPSPPDFVDIENIIYPAGSTAPSGTYQVRVDHYLNCDSNLQAVPFQVEVRQGSNLWGVCGYFNPNDPDWSDSGGAAGGRSVYSFTIP